MSITEAPEAKAHPGQAGAGGPGRLTRVFAPLVRGRRGVGWRKIPAPVLIAAVVVGVVTVAALGAELVRPLDESAVDLSAVLQPPSAAFPMGTDETGRDVFALVLRGLRVSVTVSLLAATIALIVGVAVGVASGGLGGRADALLMRVVDFLASQNHFLFGILLVVLFRPLFGPAGAVLLSVGLTHWLAMARIVRGELLSLRERPFVAAAVNSGASRWYLARRHYLPHLLPAAGLGLVLLLPHAIFHESALSFLGLGLPAHRPSLGNLVAAGERSLLAGGWWMSLFPGLGILIASAGIGTLGEYWRDRHQPRWRSELEL